jgi:hypothetical protein
MSEAEKRVHCARHGETAATFVCRHLQCGVACGFHRSGEDSSDQWPDAWCDRCEAAFQREGEWNESNEPGISLLCTGCYEDTRERNEHAPAPLVKGQLSVSEAEFAELARIAYDRCKLRQEVAQGAWPKFLKSAEWLFDDEARTIRFFDNAKEEALEASVTIAGSFSTTTNTWLWAWANQHYPERERAAVAPLRAFGEVRGIDKFRYAHWDAQEVEAWEVTQIAAELLGSAAIYRAPMDHLRVFMLLDDFRLVYPA